MLEINKKQRRFYLYLSASLDGLGIILLGIVLEILLRIGLYFELLTNGAEGFIFTSLLCFGGTWSLINCIKVWLKIRKNERKSHVN